MDPFVSFSFFNVSPLPHMLFSLSLFFFFFSPPTSQISHLFRFSFCLSIPPKPNPNSINQSQNCILNPIPLSEISARLLPPGNHIGSDWIGSYANAHLGIGCQVPEFDSKSSIPKEAAVELLMLSDFLH